MLLVTIVYLITIWSGVSEKGTRLNHLLNLLLISDDRAKEAKAADGFCGCPEYSEPLM